MKNLDNYPMRQNNTSDLKTNLLITGEVFFNPETNTFIGAYGDELSAHRAKKVWQTILYQKYYLEEDNDYLWSINQNNNQEKFILYFKFISAAGKYAFWQITNNDVPEIQYLLEIAHIPPSENQFYTALITPDMKEIQEDEYLLSSQINDSINMLSKIKNIINNITKTIK